MSKQTALFSKLYVGGVDISGDTNSVDGLDKTRATLTATGLDVSSEERIFGLRDGAARFTSFFNPDAASAFDTLSDGLPDADTLVMWALSTDGAALAAGDPAFFLNAKEASYQGRRGADASLTFSSDFVADGFGAEWGSLLTAGEITQSSAGSTASVDGGAASANGLQAYLQLLAFTGTSITVTIEESSDAGGGDAWAAVTDGAFSAMTAAGAQRIQTANSQTVEQHLRVTTSGTFTNAVFLVAVERNAFAVDF